MTRTAIIVLNRNLPEATDRLVEQFLEHATGDDEVFVVESGSDQESLSKYCTWWADWPEAMRDGLRYPRGFNYGLSQIHKSGAFDRYDYFFLVCNDIEFSGPLVPILVEEMRRHPKVGILSPCAENWAEGELIGRNGTRYVSHINHVAWLLRREFIEAVMVREAADHMNFLYDGSNFRGYYADQELIIKGYINQFASALTTKAMISERTELLKTRYDLIRTDRYEINQRRVFREGQQWMHRKYGFSTRYQMNMYADMFFKNFFVLHPHLTKFCL